MARPVKTLSTSAEALIPYRYEFIVLTCLIPLLLAQSSLAAVLMLGLQACSATRHLSSASHVERSTSSTSKDTW
eukprot:scaffold16123_cov78-Phaeocystis_antarctica.AAC.1